MASLKGVICFTADDGKEVIVVNGQVFKETDKDAEAGDIIRFLGEEVDLTQGKFYQVNSDDNGPVITDDVDDDRYGVITGPLSVSKAVYERVEPQTTAEQNQESTQKNDYELGDIVVLVEKSTATLGFKVGDICEITEAFLRGTYYYGIRKGGNQDYVSGYVNAEHIKRWTPKFAEGDNVVVIGNTCESDPHELEIGDIVTIDSIDTRDKRQPYLFNGWWAAEAYLRLATESDMNNLKWKELGRSVGEFREGDIVRIINDRNGPVVGAIGVVTNASPVEVEINGERFLEEPELIAPVEAVVNLRIR